MGATLIEKAGQALCVKIGGEFVLKLVGMRRDRIVVQTVTKYKLPALFECH